MAIVRCCALVWAVLLVGAQAHAQTVPLQGCYVRVYDAKHLAAHKGQIVVRAVLSVQPSAKESRLDEAHIADGTLKIWVRGRKQSFDSLGACYLSGSGLTCGGSLSAAEADTCRSKRDGVRDCRIDPSDAGGFDIAPRGDDVLVSVRERLELVPAPYDAGPFLSLSAREPENRAFLLKRTDEADCR
jgi:hypothetical protein